MADRLSMTSRHRMYRGFYTWSSVCDCGSWPWRRPSSAVRVLRGLPPGWCWCSRRAEPVSHASVPSPPCRVCSRCPGYAPALRAPPAVRRWCRCHINGASYQRYCRVVPQKSKPPWRIVIKSYSNPPLRLDFSSISTAKWTQKCDKFVSNILRVTWLATLWLAVFEAAIRVKSMHIIKSWRKIRKKYMEIQSISYSTLIL